MASRVTLLSYNLTNEDFQELKTLTNKRENLSITFLYCSFGEKIETKDFTTTFKLLTCGGIGLGQFLRNNKEKIVDLQITEEYGITFPNMKFFSKSFDFGKICEGT